MEKPRDERYEACFRLFLLHKGKNFCLIEREMRALGYADFNRRILYSRTEKGEYKPGWIERDRWGEQLRSADCGVRSEAKNLAAIGHEFARIDSTPRNPQFALRSPQSKVPQSFKDWLKAVSPEMTWNWQYQRYIYKHLQRVTNGESKRLMIFLPPRHGKSEMVTVRYAGWRLWNNPKMRIILTSYNQRLADKFSRSIRRLLSYEEDKLVRTAECGVRNEEANDAGSNTCSRQHADDPGGSSQTDRSQIANRQSQIPQRMFPKTRTINTVSEWETAAGGGVKAVGVGAGVTGFGAQLVIIDDPVKSRADAESETLREKVWDWYRNDLYTRLEPNAAVVLIQTRWHEDDLAGRLLRDMKDGGDQWEVVNLPALAERSADTPVRMSAKHENEPRPSNNSEQTGQPGHTKIGSPEEPAHADKGVRSPFDEIGRIEGDALCPARFDVASLEEIRRQLGSYAFSALYQQRPTPAEGGTFKRAWFKRFVARPPEGLKWKRGYDLAVSTKTTACYTASFRVAYDEDGNMYIADGFRKRIEFPEQRRYIVSRLLEEKDTEHGIEKPLHGEAMIQELRREPRIRGRNLRSVTVSSDKLTRALNWAPLAEEGKVILVRGPWNQAFLDEVCSFPGGQFDDQVDAISLAVAMSQDKGRKMYTF